MVSPDNSSITSEAFHAPAMFSAVTSSPSSSLPYDVKVDVVKKVDKVSLDSNWADSSSSSSLQQQQQQQNRHSADCDDGSQFSKDENSNSALSLHEEEYDPLVISFSNVRGSRKIRGWVDIASSPAIIKTTIKASSSKVVNYRQIKNKNL